jgi:hypothetical protein
MHILDWSKPQPGVAYVFFWPVVQIDIDVMDFKMGF